MFDLKKQIKWAQIKSGVIITLALAILFMSVFFAGSIERVLHPKVEIKAAIRDVKGLKKGAPVWVYGLEEGSVSDISLDPTYGTVVTMSIYKKVLDFLKKDSGATVLTMGLLGDKYIELPFRRAQQVAVFQLRPAHFEGSRNLVCCQCLSQRHRRPLIEEDAHGRPSGHNLSQ